MGSEGDTGGKAAKIDLAVHRGEGKIHWPPAGDGGERRAIAGAQALQTYNVTGCGKLARFIAAFEVQAYRLAGEDVGKIGAGVKMGIGEGAAAGAIA